MTVETEGSWEEKAGERAPVLWRSFSAWLGQRTRVMSRYGFSSLTRRILILNLVALVGLLSGMFFMNQFREGLIDARIQSLLTQGEIIAAAISASATVDVDTITVDPELLLNLENGQSIPAFENEFDSLQFPIDPTRVAPILRHLILPTGTRARIYDQEGSIILDSRDLYTRGQILRYDLPAIGAGNESWLEQAWRKMMLWLRRGDLPLYEELGPDSDRTYPEVTAAMAGSKGTMVRVNEHGELLVSVAVPVRRNRPVMGVLLLSTRGGDIDAVLRAERMAILRVFGVAVIVTIFLSVILAGTIAGPMHRLASAAERVRHSLKAREEIPDFTSRRDEIGHLSGALREMTDALYTRIEAIESFAADVAHELKNPLTSLRSAVETLPLARTPEDQQRLIDVVQHDVRRLDRLISDISDASRLDAELALADAEPVDMAALLEAVVAVANEARENNGAEIVLDVRPTGISNSYLVYGHSSRLGQVVDNLLSNANSFAPTDTKIKVTAFCSDDIVEVRVEDEGPGIPPDNLDRIFARFYTDRPEGDAFGNNSGLGLSISKQIIESHGGRIWAEARRDVKAPQTSANTRGARFIIQLPAISI